MAPFIGSSGNVPLLLLTIVLIITTFPPPSSSQVKVYSNSTIGVSVFMPEHGPGSKLTDSVKAAIINEIFEYTLGTIMGTGVMYDHEKYALLVAITRHDLHRFANYSCDVDCAARWLQLGGGIYDREVTKTHELNCTDYAIPVNEYDSDMSNLQLEHHYSVAPITSDWSDYYLEIDQLTYGQVVIKWTDEMKLVEQYRVKGGSTFCYNIPTEFAYARRAELLVSILWAFRQTIEVGWYFEHFTLATFLEPFCGPQALPHSNQYSFHYFVWSLSNAVPFATNESIRSYVSSICPVYGTQFPVHFAADLHEVFQGYYRNVNMQFPDIMHHYVSEVMLQNIQHFIYDERVIDIDGAFEWIHHDFFMYHHGKYYGDHHSDSIDRSITRKIVFHQFVSQLAVKVHEISQKKAKEAATPELSRLHFRNITVGLVYAMKLLVVGCIFWLFSCTIRPKIMRKFLNKTKIRFQKIRIRKNIKRYTKVN